MPDGGASCFSCGYEISICDRRKLARRSKTVNYFRRFGALARVGSKRTMDREKSWQQISECPQVSEVGGGEILSCIGGRKALAAQLHHSDGAVVPHDGRAQDLVNGLIKPPPERDSLKHAGMAKR